MKRLGFLLAATLLLLRLWPSDFVAAQTGEQAVAVITSPMIGEQLFGQVNIRGSAGHPTAFESYTLEYKDLSEPGASWLLVQPPIRQQVENNVLGAWNTNMVPDGTYSLRLRVSLQDEQIIEYMVPNLRVINSQPTAVPTVAGAESPAAITPGPSPTSPIEQPPSNNPDPNNFSGLDSAVPGAADESVTDPPQRSTRVNTRRIRQAFCSGVYLALVIFGAMLGYLLVRGRIRPITRRLLWQLQDEFDRD